jgi:glycosyltransferase involved in cell wall biosynthesis
MRRPQLTIGMATYRDYDGVYFTIQALRLYQDLTDVELLVVDNYGCTATRDLLENWQGGRYLLSKEQVGTSAPRDRVFREAQGEAVVCLDSHVLLAPGVIARLKAYYNDHPESLDLLQGPMMYDDLRSLASHFDPEWRANMWGIWAVDDRAEDPESEPFEIPMQGLGLFSCRKDAWPGFNPHFRGFGGEEGYIHEKFRQLGRRCLCLPWLRWGHRFKRPEGVPYRLDLRDRIVNYLIGHRELGLDETPVVEHFAHVGTKHIEVALAEADKVYPRKTPAQPPAAPALLAPAPVAPLRAPVRSRPLSVLGCWYSNNDIHPEILRACLDRLAIAQECSGHQVHVRTCTWEPIDRNPFRGYITHFRHGSHLGIALQILRVLYEARHEQIRPDVVCFLEHDVLYPEDYFDRVADALCATPEKMGVVHMDYIGMNHTGWCDVTCRQAPMHQLSLRYPVALDHLESVQRQCILKAAVNLEPEDRSKFALLPFVGDRPSVHINHSRHFTSHYNCYARDSGGNTVHPYWGDFRQYYPEDETHAPG